MFSLQEWYLSYFKNKKRHIYGGHICVRKMFYIYNKILEILNMIPPIKNTHFGQYKLLSVNRTHLQNKKYFEIIVIGEHTSKLFLH